MIVPPFWSIPVRAPTCPRTTTSPPRSAAAVSDPVHPFAWFTVAQIGEIEMFEDTRLLARALFGCAGGLAGEVRVDEVVAALSHA